MYGLGINIHGMEKKMETTIYGLGIRMRMAWNRKWKIVCTA